MRAIRRAGNANRSLAWFLVIFGLAGLVVASLASGRLPRSLFPAARGALPALSEAAAAPVPAVLAASAPLVDICAIQGSGFKSPYEGRPVRIRGLVVADLDDTTLKGLFLQQFGCDGDPATSDGIFVFLGARVSVADPSDRIEVSGRVREFFGQTELEAAPTGVSILEKGLPAPDPLELAPPFSEFESRRYFEAREGMLLSLGDGRVVGPTSPRGVTWLIRSDLGMVRVFRDDPRGTGQIIPISDAGEYGLPLAAKVGDRVAGVRGVLTYSLGEYQVILTAEPVIQPSSGSEGRPLPPEPASDSRRTDQAPLHVASLNVKNLFDTQDEPLKNDPVLSASAYQQKLSKLALTIRVELGEPDLIGLQEAENGLVLQDLLNRPEIQADYGYLWIDGPDQRGIDVALLYRKDRFRPNLVETRQGCTALVDGLGPDGNRSVDQPVNARTCDANGDGTLDGNRLFSRPPLVVRLEMTAGGPSPPLAGARLWILVNHWKSKSQDTATTAHTLPRRIQQAEFVAALVREIQAAHPGSPLMVLGDLNDFTDSLPLAALEAAGLFNLVRAIPRTERYTFIYRGVSQTLDHILVSPELADQVIAARAVHINADFPYVFEGVAETSIRSSDHDPLLVTLYRLHQRHFLPIFLGQRVLAIL